MATVLRNPQKLASSGIFSTSLITYPDGNNRTTDIDFASQKFGFFIFGESKEFWKDEIRISLAQYDFYSELYHQLPRCQMIFVGTDSYTKVTPDDIIWYTTMSLIEKRFTKIIQTPDTVIHREEMYPASRRDFDEWANNLLEFYADPYEVPKKHEHFVTSQVKKY